MISSGLYIIISLFYWLQQIAYKIIYSLTRCFSQLTKNALRKCVQLYNYSHSRMAVRIVFDILVYTEMYECKQEVSCLMAAGQWELCVRLSLLIV